MTEYLLSTDEFSQPKELTDQTAFGVLLVRMLLLQPGTNPLHPDMGVGLVPKYRFITNEDMPELTSRIKNQIQTYFPIQYSANAQVYLEIKPSKYLKITIITDGTSYVFDTEDSIAPIQLTEAMH